MTVKFKPFLLKCLLLIAGLGAVCPLAGFCEQRELKSDAQDQVDAILLLDSSGSMLRTDPMRLRDEGVRLFAQFLKSGDRLSVIEFSEKTKIIRGLEPFESSQLDDLVKQISSIEPLGQYTDITDGLKLAYEMAKTSQRKDVRTIIILLSDGKLEPDPRRHSHEAALQELENGVLPDIKAGGMQVYTLAFSELADKELLSQIAAAADGANWFAPEADRIHKYFADLILAVKKPQVVPLGGKAFNVDPDIQEATFYVTREQGQEVTVINPADEKITQNTTPANVRWYTGQKFDVITISNPAVGGWQVQGISPQEGFATILTNLKLVTDFPVSIAAGSPQLLQARLYEGLKPVSLPEMTAAMRYAFQITPTDKVSEPIVRELLMDNGTHGDKVADDGIFSAMVALDEPGEYKLRVLAKGSTIERQQQIPFKVRPQVVAVKIKAPETHEGEKDVAAEGADANANGKEEGKRGKSSLPVMKGGSDATIRVILSDEAKFFRNIQVKLFATDEQRSRYLLPIVKSLESALEFEVPASALPHPGKYEFKAVATSEVKGKGERRDESQPLLFTLIEASEAPKQEAVQVVEKPKGPPWYQTPTGKGIIQFILIALLSGLSCKVAFRKLEEAQGEAVSAIPEFPVPPEITKGIATLEAKSALSEVDLNDPMFTEEPPAEQASENAVAGEAGGEALPQEAALSQPEEAGAVASGQAAEVPPAEEGEAP